MIGLKKFDLPGVGRNEAKQLAQAALTAVRHGNLGYTTICASKD
jgi:hypothetical protein